MAKTIPDVFIIESLSFDDEKNELYEGKILSNILKLNDKKPIYYYIRTKRELDEVLDIFKDSTYRYLHISCHGSNNSMETTLDSIDFKDLAIMVKPSLRYRRLFISACNMVNSSLAKEILPRSKCHSIIGPYLPVNFNDSAIFWSSFYHLMFKENETSMNLKDLKFCIKKLTYLFEIPINYYTASKRLKQGFSYRKINASKKL